METHTSSDWWENFWQWGQLVGMGLAVVGVVVVLCMLVWMLLYPPPPAPANSRIASYPGALYTTCVNSANVAVDPSSCGITPTGSLSSTDLVVGQASTDWQDGQAVALPGGGFHPLKTTMAVTPGTKVNSNIVVNPATGQTLARISGRLTSSGIAPRPNGDYPNFAVSGLTGWLYYNGDECPGTGQNVLTHSCN